MRVVFAAGAVTAAWERFAGNASVAGGSAALLAFSAAPHSVDLWVAHAAVDARAANAATRAAADAHFSLCQFAEQQNF